MIHLRRYLALSLLLTCVLNSFAADQTDNRSTTSILVEPAQLLKNLNGNNVRILDVRSQAEYRKGHIAGAVRVDVADWKGLALKERGLLDAKNWSAKVGSLGISNDTHVVVYGSRVTNVARIWWLLKYVGLQRASILNGGWDLWTRQNRPVEVATPKVPVARFRPKFQAERLAKMDAVRQLLKVEKVKVVDTRSDREFAGGRIPNSVHLEWKHLLREDGRFKTKAQLKDIFRKQGILPTDTAVCY